MPPRGAGQPPLHRRGSSTLRKRPGPSTPAPNVTPHHCAVPVYSCISLKRRSGRVVANGHHRPIWRAEYGAGGSGQGTQSCRRPTRRCLQPTLIFELVQCDPPGQKADPAGAMRHADPSSGSTVTVLAGRPRGSVGCKRTTLRTESRKRPRLLPHLSAQRVLRRPLLPRRFRAAADHAPWRITKHATDVARCPHDH